MYGCARGRRADHEKGAPCGEKRWQVLRIGADFELRCLGCGREIMGARSKFEKQIRSIDRPQAEEDRSGKN